MRHIAIKIAYDGTNYFGWQRQPEQISVQQATERALSRLLNEDIALTGAGRTDSGVHAAAAVAAFYTYNPIPVYNLATAANRLLPPDIRLLGAYEVPDSFHPRKSEHHKTYVYSIAMAEPDIFAARYCYFEPRQLDIAAMKQAAAYLTGEHDFKNFSVTGSSAQTTVRSVDHIEIIEKPQQEGNTLWTATPPLLQIEVTAGGFLYKMVRLIAAALLQVGRGEIQPEYMTELLEAKPCRPIPPLPPQGLMLKNIIYDDFEKYFYKN